MVARLLWEQDAAGSNPVTSTTHKTPGTRMNAGFFRGILLTLYWIYP